MITATDPRALARAEHLAARERYRPAPETVCCPECGHDSYVVTGSQPATRTDPAWQTGYCENCEGEE